MTKEDEGRHPGVWVTGGAIIGATLGVVLPHFAPYTPPPKPIAPYQGDIVRTTLPVLVCPSVPALRDARGCHWADTGTPFIVLDTDSGLVLLRPVNSLQRLVAWDGSLKVVHDILDGGPLEKVRVSWPITGKREGD